VAIDAGSGGNGGRVGDDSVPGAKPVLSVMNLAMHLAVFLSESWDSAIPAFWNIIFQSYML
jgi:hypothetical protein